MSNTDAVFWLGISVVVLLPAFIIAALVAVAIFAPRTCV